MMEYLQLMTLLMPDFDPDNLPLGLFVLYIGPETVLPLTSFLAAVFGVLMMGWRYIVGLVRRAWRSLSGVASRIFHGT